MKLIILTSSLHGTASHHLDHLINAPGIDIRLVLFNEGKVTLKKKFVFRKIKKIIKIGILGTLNGLRMRKWYGKDLEKYIHLENLESKCKKLNIPFSRTTSLQSPETVELFNMADADIGISLGNGYIPERIFSIPKFGMINIHHEILPDYQNAQSVIWQLYNGSNDTGYTIHRIDCHIDNGEIILQEKVPIYIRETLADTVTYTYLELLKNSATGLTKVLSDFEYYKSKMSTQGHGKSYTTPGIRQYLKIVRQFRKLKKIKNEITDKQ